jgi:hypothetical protein
MNYRSLIYWSEIIMPNHATGQVIKRPYVLLQDLEGEAVLLNLENGQYYGMDENSHHMFTTLVSMSTVQAAYEALLDEYDIEPEQLRVDLDQFITTLLENGLIIYVDSHPG